MFDELNKYQCTDHFFVTKNDKLASVCNAPTDKSGVYIVYALKNDKVELIYIGRSGRHLADGSMFIRSTGLGGIKDRIVNGHHFGKIPRHRSWINQISKENIDALDVYWFATHSNKYSDCPKALESTLLKKYVSLFGRLPLWNKKI